MNIDGDGGIAVVITAYQCAQYLGQAIASVLSQTRPAQQIILIDDGSTDDCAEVARAFGAEIQYHFQSNAGSAAARNAGIRRAQGHWLALLDGDDFWEPDKLASQLDAVHTRPTLEAVFGHVRQFASPELDPHQASRLRVASDPMPAYYASTLLIRRKSFLRVGFFDERYRISEFVDWFGRAVDTGLDFSLLPSTVAWRRLHTQNSTLRQRDSRQEYARVMKRMLDRRRRSTGSDGA